MQGGIVRLARDASQSIPVGLFSMRNILRGSFSVHYLMPTEETADAVETAYFDRNYWAPRRVQSKLAGSAAAKPVKVDLFGVTDHNQAFREGLYQAACNRYRRKIIKFQTEMEGFIPSFGDLIAISHDMPQWGQFAEVLGYDNETLLLAVSEPLVFTTGTHYVGLRRRDGSVSGPYAVTAGPTDYQVHLSTTLDFTPYTGMNEERTHIVFGPGETWRQPAKVISVRPRGLYAVEIECINEDPSVHTAESGQTAPAVNYSQLPTLYTAPIIKTLNLKSSTSDVSKALIVWTPAPGADTYQIEMASGTDPDATGLVWTRVAETTANNWAVTALYGSQTLIRVRGVGLVAGPWVSLFYGSSSDYMWTNDAALMWNVNDTTLMWK
jgi:predicted phage tail protein